MINKMLVSVALLENSIKFEYYINLIYETMSDLVSDYPNFNSWYFNKVVPGIISGEREIIVAIYNQSIAGLSIIKDTKDEKKICTIRVFPKFQNKGIGKKLFEKSFKLLDTDKPLITVSQSRLEQFNSILDYYGFELSDVHEDYYIRGQKEYVYNGTLFVSNNKNKYKSNIKKQIKNLGYCKLEKDRFDFLRRSTSPNMVLATSGLRADN